MVVNGRIPILQNHYNKLKIKSAIIWCYVYKNENWSYFLDKIIIKPNIHINEITPFSCKLNMELVNYDNIITASGRKLKKSKKIVKNIKEEHDMFIDFVLKHLPMYHVKMFFFHSIKIKMIMSAFYTIY